mmetsp:Transcript_17362/g.42475  ORF Transcript_17362/g.42475 Transcript_17362/m.42475 type:complete len:81 (+) Transcript_17362:894-1136(+)
MKNQKNKMKSIRLRVLRRTAILDWQDGRRTGKRGINSPNAIGPAVCKPLGGVKRITGRCREKDGQNKPSVGTRSFFLPSA